MNFPLYGYGTSTPKVVYKVIKHTQIPFKIMLSTISSTTAPASKYQQKDKKKKQSRRQLSKFQKQELKEEKERQAVLRTSRRQAYQQRRCDYKQRQTPAWVKERDAQRAAADAKAMKNGEMVVVVNAKSNRNRTKKLFAEHLPTKQRQTVAVKNAFADLDSSDEEDDAMGYEETKTPDSPSPQPSPRAPAELAACWQNVSSNVTVAAAPQSPPSPGYGNGIDKVSFPISMAPTPKPNGDGWGSDIEDEDEESKECMACESGVDADVHLPGCVANEDRFLPFGALNPDGSMKSWADMCDEDAAW